MCMGDHWIPKFANIFAPLRALSKAAFWLPFSVCEPHTLAFVSLMTLPCCEKNVYSIQMPSIDMTGTVDEHEKTKNNDICIHATSREYVDRDATLIHAKSSGSDDQTKILI